MSFVEEDHVIDFLPAFVLGALTEDEKPRVSTHLAECPYCQAELARLQLIADDLPMALTQAAPPPYLKGKLMHSIRARKSKQPEFSEPAPFLQRLSTYFRNHLPAFGLALIMILALGNLMLWRQLNLTSRATSSPMRLFTLTNTQFSPGASGTVVVSPNGHDFTLVVADLAALDVNKQYQVWLIKGAMHTSAGVFSVNPNGYASVEITWPEPLAQYDAIGISVEPAGGSAAPTGTSVLHAYLTK